MTEATTSGTTTNWIASRNSRPGSATQLPTRVETSADSRSAVGPISVPNPTPRNIATSTCSHNRSLIRKNRCRRKPGRERVGASVVWTGSVSLFIGFP